MDTMFKEGQIYQLFPSKPFLFNPKTMEFVVGGISRKLDDVEDIYTLDPNSIEKGPTEFDDNVPLLLDPWSTIIQMPSLRQRIVELKNREIAVSQEIRKVMAQVWQSRNPQIKLPKRTNRRNFIHFSVSFHSHGRFNLQTFGSCACLGSDPSPNFILYHDLSSPYENLQVPLSYSLHNAYTPGQRLSLYAGVGTLAWMLRQTKHSHR